ncbi:MAG: T9SS type A sorting domain-containing protein [Candidatus Eisenbacteria bacterium]|nr:T9SS type A sorting domain-containing protein [Candidatus Eisenbacteria bacterium]
MFACSAPGSGPGRTRPAENLFTAMDQRALCSPSFQLRTGWLMRRRQTMKRTGRVLTALVLLVIPGLLQAATLEVSQPVQVTNDSHYERGQSLTYDGSDYWLFYGRSASVTGSYQTSDPDVHDYVVHWKKAATIAGLASATPGAIPGATDSYLGETGAAYFGGEVWAFATVDVGSTAEVYGWYSGDGGATWTQVASMATGLSDGAAHHDEVAFNGELYLALRRGAGFFTTHSSSPKSGGWSTEVQVNTGADAGGGLCHFFVDDGTLYLAVVRTPAPRANMVFEHDEVTDSWTKIAETPSDGWDPTLFKVGMDYVFVQAPWVSDGGGRQYSIQWSGPTLDSSFFSGGSYLVTEGRYGANTWTDMWPIGYTDQSGGSYLFITSERDDPAAEGTGNIWYLEMEWNLDRDHYTYVQEALDAAADGDEILVSEGTYDESLNIANGLDLIGAGAASVTVTGGVTTTNTTPAVGLTLEGLTLSGVYPDAKFATIRLNNSGTLADIAVRDCVLDGEDIADSKAFYGQNMTGDWTISGTEFKNYTSWYLFDNTPSDHDVAYKLDTVVFEDNHIHDCAGSGAIRGKVTDPTDLIIVSGNTFEDYPAAGISQAWAALEANNAAEIRIYSNHVEGVPQNGDEGQAFQVWSATPWTVDIHDNVMLDNHQGIYIWSLLEDELWNGGDTPLYVPAGSITDNVISGCTDFTIWISDLPVGSGTSSAIGGPLDAVGNWWGDATGPYHPTLNPTGGAARISDNIVFDPWKAGNVVCVPDPQEISLADLDGTDYKDTVRVRYMGGGSGPVYGYSIDVEWNDSVVTAAASDFSRPDTGPFASAVLFQVVELAGNKVRIDAALGGSQTGTLGPDDLFKALFTAVGAPDYATSPVTLTLVKFRDGDNNTLSGFANDDGEIAVDLVGPAISAVAIANTTLSHTDDYIKNGDGAQITASVADGDPGFAAGDITADLSGLGGGTAVTPDSYTAGTATWTLASVSTTPDDGTVTVTVSASDPLGNAGSSDDTIIADNTKPAALTGLTAEPGHKKVSLTWNDPSGNDLNYAGVAVRYNQWNGYPGYAYGGAPEPSYPQNEIEGAEAYSGTGTAAEHTFTDYDRDIYYYGAFVYDMALNYSDPESSDGNEDRATNYWLGDVAPDGVWDGSVGTADISALGSTYYSYTNPQCDVAPTDDYSREGIPIPDGLVDFEDLMIFALNYGVVAPVQEAPFAAPDAPVAGRIALMLEVDSGSTIEEELFVRVHLVDEAGAVQGVRLAVHYDPGVLEYVGVQKGSLVAGTEPHAFFAVESEGYPELGLAALGAGKTFGGSGELAVLRFRTKNDGLPDLRFKNVAARDAGNQELLPQTADIIGGSETAEIPTRVFLRANSPNPFRASTAITFGLPVPDRVTLAVYDVNGRNVATLIEGLLPAGEHVVTWNRSAREGRSVASGLYLYRLETSSQTITRKMMVNGEY